MIYTVKIFHLLFSITLIMFAGLQINDPDPIVWVGFYLLCALIPALLTFNRFYPPLFWVAVTGCVIELIISAPGAYEYFLRMGEEPLMQGMNENKPYIEECREFLGALIALGLVSLSAAMMRMKILNKK
jgi:hypothetical protein